MPGSPDFFAKFFLLQKILLFGLDDFFFFLILMASVPLLKTLSADYSACQVLLKELSPHAPKLGEQVLNVVGLIPFDFFNSAHFSVKRPFLLVL